MRARVKEREKARRPPRAQAGVHATVSLLRAHAQFCKLCRRERALLEEDGHRRARDD